jgi:uncharacterized protein
MDLKRHILCIGFVAGCALGAAAPSLAGDLPILSADTTFNVRVTSLKEMHFLRVVHQAYDYSCGSAAVATLLTYHYNHPVLESSVLKAMFEVGEQDQIRKEGFSLLDMKRYLASIGFHAEGYEVSLDKIATVGVPGIVLIKTKGYQHFVVLKGIRGDSVLLGDPALGARFMSRAEFSGIWNGIFFVIVGHTNEAKKEFNRTEDWATVSSAPLSAVNAGWSLANTLLMTPGRNNF